MHQINSYGCSFPGRRKNNEDSFIIVELIRGFNLYAVADGMGGANAGEVASSLAIEVITNFFRNEFKLDFTYTDEEISGIIKRGYRKVQKALYDDTVKNPEYSGMGTTLVLLLDAGNRWFCANIGDSRLYKIVENNIQLITNDHSLLQEYIDSNDKLPDAEWVNRYSSYLTKALDGSKNEPDIFILNNEGESTGSGMCYLLCSDGLFPKGIVSKDIPIQSIIHRSADIYEASEQLISYAFYNGSSDNITVLLIETTDFKRTTSNENKYPYPPVENTTPLSNTKRFGFLFYFLCGAILVCLIAIILLVLRPKPSAELLKEKIQDTLLLKRPNSDSFSLRGTSKKINSHWQSFDSDDYTIRVNGSTILKWNQVNCSTGPSFYLIYVNNQNIPIDSFSGNPGLTSISFDRFKGLNIGVEYQLNVKAS